MRALLIVLVVIFAVLAVGLWVAWGLGQWVLDRDTQAVLVRAQVAANAADMSEYMVQLQKSMEDKDMTKGHAALVFRTPQNDMSLIYKTVVRVNERLAAIKGLSQSETTYQVALDDLRGTVRELDLNTGGWFWTQNWWWIVLSFVSVLLAVVFGIIAYHAE